MPDETIFQGSRLCVVGNICRDVKTAAIPQDDSLFADGETPTGSIVDTIGGGGANSALAAAALGAEARFAGKVGADALGRQLEAELVRRGVRPYLCRDPHVQTGSSLVLRFTNGCRHFISCQPNNYALAFPEIDLSMLAGVEHLLRADVWFSEPMLAGGNARLFQAARELGLATSLDLNWDPCWGFADEKAIAARKQAVRQLLPMVDLAHGNIRELNRFADSDDLAVTLDRLAAWGAGAVVIHMGADGAGYYCRGELTVEPCQAVQECKNAAGSGDILSVCMILLHKRGELPIAEKLRLANQIAGEFIAGKRDLLPPL